MNLAACEGVFDLIPKPYQDVSLIVFGLVFLILFFIFRKQIFAFTDVRKRMALAKLQEQKPSSVNKFISSKKGFFVLLAVFFICIAVVIRIYLTQGCLIVGGAF